MESRWIFGRRLLLMLRTANKPNVRLWVSPLMLHSFLVNLLKLSRWKQACNKHTFLIGRTRHMFIITGLRVLICAPFRTPWSKIPLAQLWKHGPLHSTKSSKHQHLPQHLNTFLMSDKWGVASWRSPFFKKTVPIISTESTKHSNVSVSEVLSPAFEPTGFQIGSCGDGWWCYTDVHVWRRLWSV